MQIFLNNKGAKRKAISYCCSWLFPFPGDESYEGSFKWEPRIRNYLPSFEGRFTSIIKSLRVRLKLPLWNLAEIEPFFPLPNSISAENRQLLTFENLRPVIVTRSNALCNPRCRRVDRWRIRRKEWWQCWVELLSFSWLCALSIQNLVYQNRNYLFN